MPKEHLTTRSDARLANTALSLAEGFIDSKLNAEQVGGLEGQKNCLQGNYKDAFKAVADKMDHGSEDVRGLFRLARKIRSLLERAR